MPTLREVLPIPIQDLLFKIRAPIMRFLKPKKSYFLFPAEGIRSIDPISNSYGFDRGRPVDRYYIEKFLEENKEAIKGKCLEVDNDRYTRHYGEDAVTHIDVLDINPDNKLATIHGDLRNLSMIESDTYDCLVMTQVFGMVDDCEAAIRECYRILKPGGTIVGTATCMGRIDNPEYVYWRFTTASIEYLFAKYFSKRKVKAYGNVLSGQAGWVGMASNELTQDELDYSDPHFPMVVGFACVK